MSLNAFHRWQERRRLPLPLPPPPLCLAPLLSMRHLIVSSFRRAFGFRAYGCQECCCGSRPYLSSSSIRAKMLTHLCRAIARYSPDVNIPQLWLLIRRNWFCSCFGRLSFDRMNSVYWGFCVTTGNRAPSPLIRALIILSSVLLFLNFNVPCYQFH